MKREYPIFPFNSIMININEQNNKIDWLRLVDSCWIISMYSKLSHFLNIKWIDTMVFSGNKIIFGSKQWHKYKLSRFGFTSLEKVMMISFSWKNIGWRNQFGIRILFLHHYWWKFYEEKIEYFSCSIFIEYFSVDFCYSIR